MIESVFDWLLDPSMRTFYGYWLSTFAIILIWCRLQWSSRKSAFMEWFSIPYWWNSSSQQDYVFLAMNRLIFFALGIAWLAITIDIAQWTNHALNWLIGSHVYLVSEVTLGILVIYTFALFLLDDVSRFLLHKAMHKFSWLWRIHQVHHSATSMTPFTTYRLHPLESLLYQARASLVHGSCAGVAFYSLGQTLSGFEIFGASIWVIAFNALGANLRHSQINLSYGPLERFFISPAQHQLHHGLNTMQSNFGSYLSIWDQLGNSWLSGVHKTNLPIQHSTLTDQLLLKPLKWK